MREEQIIACRHCNDTGTLHFARLKDDSSYALPPDVPPNMVVNDFPDVQLEACACDCLKDKRTQEKLAHLMDGGGVPKLYRSFTFATWEAQPKADRAGKEDARRVCEQFANGQLVIDGVERYGLVLSGGVGRGKTGLASCVLMERARRGENVLWVDFSKFIRRIRSTYHEDSVLSYEEVVGAAASVPFLLIDDMGDMDAVRSISDDLRRNVYDVISERYNELRPTLITTNLTAEQFRATFGDRVADRVLYLYHWQDVSGINLRF